MFSIRAFGRRVCYFILTFECVKVLIEAGAALNSTDKVGWETRTHRGGHGVVDKPHALFCLFVLILYVPVNTRDRGAAGSSLTGVTALWSLSKTHLS